MFTIKSDFIGVFKVGDNINHNLKILALLYSYYDKATDEEKCLLRKPIVILIGSIAEAFLFDLHKKARLFTQEGVGELSDGVLSYIRGKRIEEFEKYIASARKHNLLDLTKEDERLYDDLEELRKLRNRVHIQNSKNHFESDEPDAFSEARKIHAEETLERLTKCMAHKFSRGESQHYVEDFVFPWNQHYLPYP